MESVAECCSVAWIGLPATCTRTFFFYSHRSVSRRHESNLCESVCCIKTFIFFCECPCRIVCICDDEIWRSGDGCGERDEVKCCQNEALTH